MALVYPVDKKKIATVFITLFMYFHAGDLYSEALCNVSFLLNSIYVCVVNFSTVQKQVRVILYERTPHVC